MPAFVPLTLSAALPLLRHEPETGGLTGPPQFELTCTPPPTFTFRPGPEPPEPWMNPVWQSVGSRAISEFEFESPALNAATAELATPILVIPMMPARNDRCCRAMITSTKPSRPANSAADALGG